MVNFAQWYTDTVDVYRVANTTAGNLTEYQREQIFTAIPCRVYTGSSKDPQMKQTAAEVKQSFMLACDNSYAIQAGDELIVHRGALLGHNSPDLRAFAGQPHYYYEPFGGVIPGLEHQEIALLVEERT